MRGLAFFALGVVLLGLGVICLEVMLRNPRRRDW